MLQQYLLYEIWAGLREYATEYAERPFLMDWYLNEPRLFHCNYRGSTRPAFQASGMTISVKPSRLKSATIETQNNKLPVRLVARSALNDRRSPGLSNRAGHSFIIQASSADELALRAVQVIPSILRMAMVADCGERTHKVPQTMDFGDR
jgi:hypothetical protein